MMLSGIFTILQDSSAQQLNSTTNIKNQTKPIDFLVFEDSTNGIKINYPKNWESETTEEEPPLTHIVDFFSPEMGDYITLSLYTYDYSSTQIDTLKELLTDVIDSYSSYPDEFPNFKLTYSSANKTLAGKSAYIMIGQYEDPDLGKQIVFDIGTLKDGIHYYIQYFASPSQFKYYLPTIDKMVRSFEIQDVDNKAGLTSKPVVDERNEKLPAGINETPPFVKNSKIIEFSGNNFADVVDSKDLNANSFTVSTWFKTPIDTTKVTYLINKGNINKDNDITGDNLNFGLFLTKEEQVSGGFQSAVGDIFIITSPKSYADGKWHQAVLTFNQSSHILNLYLDGVEVATKTTNTNVKPDTTGNSAVRLGASSLSDDNNAIGGFKGQLDDIQIWDVTATENQVHNLFNKESKISR